MKWIRIVAVLLAVAAAAWLGFHDAHEHRSVPPHARQ